MPQCSLLTQVSFRRAGFVHLNPPVCSRQSSPYWQLTALAQAPPSVASARQVPFSPSLKSHQRPLAQLPPAHSSPSVGSATQVLSLPVVEGSSLSTSYIGTTITFVYIWLPYMILPIQASLERVPRSLIEASSDLGARPGETFRKVILPLSIPGVAAGSIFTFSLTLGDYIIPQLIGSSRPFIGQAVYQFQGTSGDIPMAAAFAMVPIAIMAVYLAIAKRFGAFDAL